VRYPSWSLNSAAALLLAACGGGATVPSLLPDVTLTASSMTVDAGDSATLTWTSTNATSCSSSGGWNGTLGVSGTQSTGALSDDTSYSLTCIGPGGTSPPATVTIAVNALPTVQLAANPTVVAAGSTSTLTWSSAHATSCAASGDWSGTLASSGTMNTGALTANAIYSLTCTGPGRSGAAATVTVNLLPIVALTAAPTAVASGGASNLTWTSTNADSCMASGGWSGTLAAGGSHSTGPLTAATAYSITCAGPGGVTAPVVTTVTILPLPTVTLTASPQVVAAGGSSTLTWTSSNATSCTASGAWSGSVGLSGTQSTGAVGATTSYSLMCSGAGGASSIATATLAVSNVTMSVSPRTAAITLARTQQFTATVPGGGAATWSVDGIANGNSTVGVISATGLYTAGAAGTHAIVATGVVNSTQTASAIAAVTDLAGVYTYHNDLARDGANTQEYALTSGNVNTTSFGKLASCPVDGAIYAQPLWVANVTLSGVKHNVLFVTTQHDSLFAFDGDSNSCTRLWSISLIDVAHGGSSGETSVPSKLLGAGFVLIQPEIGVSGTPVIDASSGILYVVSKSINAAQTTFYQRLHAIDITTGKEKTGSPVIIAATYPGTGDGGSAVAFNAKQQAQRSGLALVNGTVYIAWGSNEDISPWYGWIMGYNETALTQTAAFNSAPNVQRGGIWMSGGAPAVDALNHLYVLTGNGNFDAGNSTAPNNDYGDSLLQLNTALQVTQYFTPSDELDDVQGDHDFGSGGAAVLADLPAGNTVTHALVCGGKDGTLYVLNRDLLGGFGDSAAVQSIALGHAIFSTSAIWNNYLFVAGVGGPLAAYQLNLATVQFNPTNSSTHTYGFPGATPSVSASATTNGVVWALDTNSYCTTESKACGPAVLHAYDATKLGTELWNSGIVSTDAAGNAVKFSVPTIANGRVYVGTRGNNIGGADDSTSTPGEFEIYGLTH
jgi:hypothetical protein